MKEGRRRGGGMLSLDAIICGERIIRAKIALK